ncbi:hypothetical protein AWH63_10890 [Marinobacter sp. C18]|uniref:hypothetical protein n=1 Tax=Marinobacter sp. C18 TaxID=1772288 RepID=UPI000948F02C|nr:hypothetical protein [Marinobacter sp. C18]OLF82037.1 hypothetical protein AWH63_10890 [Marinobacter sp. C18]
MIDLTEEQNQILTRAIEDAYDSISNQMAMHWKTRDLATENKFIFDCDGLPDREPLSVASNLYATLSFTASMTGMNDWSWSMGDVFGSLTDQGNDCRIEQNFLGDMGACFDYLNGAFGEMQPPVPETFSRDNPLVVAFMTNFASYAYHSRAEADRPEWFTKDVIKADKRSYEAVLRLIDQLTNGLPESNQSAEPETPAPEANRSTESFGHAFSPVQFGFRFFDEPNQENRRSLFDESLVPFGANKLPARVTPEVILTRAAEPDAPEAVDMAILTPSTRHNPLKIRFANLNSALAASINDNFASAVCWQHLGQLTGDDADALIEGLPIQFDATLQSLLDEQDLPTDASSAMIIAAMGGHIIK